ncbi:MAG: hypothetical protein QOJ34_3111 [Pseudonocardiales bacterium]|nr:hypothetical protein [Pseudonocardiales bacterium]
MPSGAKEGGGEGLSLQTLVLAAASSAAAAIIVSHVWKGGTVVAAAMTPVIVAIVKELLAKPMDSELVRKPVQQVSRVASSSRRRVATGASVRTAGAAPPSTRAPLEPPLTEPRGVADGDGLARDADGFPPTSATDGGLTPIRTYGRPPRRRLHLKIAIVTGLVAFLIAAAVLTLPELLFGGAISSQHSTTLFGGGSSKSDKQKGNSNQNGSTQPDQSPSGRQQTNPATPPPTTGGKTPPATTPAPQPQQTTPQQTSPQQTTPVPTTPSPPVP